MKHITTAFVLVLIVATVAFAGQKYGEHTIHGMHYDRAAIEKLLDDSEVPAEVTADERGVRELKGRFKLDKSMKAEDAAVDFIDRHRNAFKLKDLKKELKFNGSYGHRTGGSTLTFQQMFKGIPVWSSFMDIDLDKDNDLTEIRGSCVPTPDIDTTPSVTEEEAVTIAKNDPEIYSGYIKWQPDVKLVIYRNTLSYEIEFAEWEYFVDARKGSIIQKRSTIYPD